jgi:hypothetical protein
MIDRDDDEYSTLLKALARISGLFSASDIPYVDSRFVEKLFVVTTGAEDLSRVDKSFDAFIKPDVGVGIKTFVADKANHKYEKVAEFAALARQGHFNTGNKKTLVHRIAKARNSRIQSNAMEFGIAVNKCTYHCLVRLPGGAIVHEEPYPLIDISNLKPLTRGGKPATDWNSMGNGVYFTDGIASYSYSINKNVLMKKFTFNRKKNFIPLEIDSDPLALLRALALLKPAKASGVSISSSSLAIDIDQSEQIKGEDYVVLPLYSLRDHTVPAKSGINQWKAGGRQRKFGEAYISIPREIHILYPEFFPPRDRHFDLLLPNGKTAQKAKVCQDGGKALMTESNVELGRWLISVVDPAVSEKDFEKSSVGRDPYSYEDLLEIGADSVFVRRTRDGGQHQYSVEFAYIGAYEEFLEQ